MEVPAMDKLNNPFLVAAVGGIGGKFTLSLSQQLQGFCFVTFESGGYRFDSAYGLEYDSF